MKTLISLAVTCVLSVGLVAAHDDDHGAGKWTKCVMELSDDRRVNVARGQYSEKACLRKGRKVAQDKGWSYKGITFHSNPVIIQAPSATKKG